jgi:branched-chain amino acid transport system substrate-binding protein
VVLAAVCISTNLAGAATKGAATRALGQKKPATGHTVKVGFISDGETQAYDNASELVAAKATVKYANEFLKGAGGRVIKLDTCVTGGTPAGTQDCVAQLATDGVVVILNGLAAYAGTIIDGAAKANIPFIEYSAADAGVLTSDDSSVIANGLADLAAPAQVAADKGLTKAGFLVIDVPSATGAVDALGPSFFKKVGVSLDVVPVAPGTADMTPQVEAMISKGVQLISMVGDVTFCTAALQAIQALGFHGSVSVVPQCFDANSPNVVKTKGLIMPTTQTSDPADHEYKLFLNVMAAFAHGTPTDAVASDGYAAVLSFVRAMVGHPAGPMTAATVKAQLLAMAPAQLPLGVTGQTFQCNRKLSAITPAVCSNAALITTLNAKGQPTGFKKINLSKILAPNG